MLVKKLTRRHIRTRIAHRFLSGNCAQNPTYCNELEGGCWYCNVENSEWQCSIYNQMGCEKME